MTAEICLINKMGIALAADSAVTIGGGNKIYNSANKLFALSKYQPVGVMIYGNANFLRVPWETIIKLYREKLGKKEFERLEEYYNDFKSFLEENEYEELTSTKEEERYNLAVIEQILSNQYDDLMRTVKSFLDEHSEILQENLHDITADLFKERIKKVLRVLDNRDYIGEFSSQQHKFLSEKYDDHIIHIIEHYFNEINVYSEQYEDLKEIVKQLLLKEFSKHSSGLVIAGFGRKDIYPVMIAHTFDGKIANMIKVSKTAQSEIGEKSDAGIYPFAQSEMVHSFLEGIDPEMKSLSDNYLHQTFHEISDIFINQLEDALKEGINKEDLELSIKSEFIKVFERYNETIEGFQKREFTDPTLAIVRSLPKGELAEMAESLVNLTSFRRKASGSLETVGGPIDVAVITKGDGLVWIKRKYYFDPDRNQHFYTNYFEEEI
ncbi:hypothetical protein [Sporosarcina sp. FSL K6-2383]|uniref:hypothetical protein n=1 Tax=Sporosarcina sp. FSL K6-2383 TaxID=2921556 RepID=UPI00315A9215